MDLSDLFGEKDVFLSIFNPLYFIEELGDTGKSLLEMYLPRVSQAEALAHVTGVVIQQLLIQGVNVHAGKLFFLQAGKFLLQCIIRQIAGLKAEIAEQKKLISDVTVYASKRAEMTFSALRMNRVEISLLAHLEPVILLLREFPVLQIRRKLLDCG